ncbi:MAG: hypothetical protein AAGA01_09500 [Cyanobacteria bacterium P01_E01_bin.43]
MNQQRKGINPHLPLYKFISLFSTATHQWEWAIGLKGMWPRCRVDDLWPPPDEACLYRSIEVCDEIPAHLATAQLSTTLEPWAVLSSAHHRHTHLPSMVNALTASDRISKITSQRVFNCHHPVGETLSCSRSWS